MKISILLAFVISVGFGCTDQPQSHSELVEQYYSSFNTGDYSKVKGAISDSFTIVSGDFIMPFDHKSFYVHYQWDSVFQSKYSIIEIEPQNDILLATVAISSVKHRFLENDSMACKYEISFQDGKMSSLKELDCLNADWQKWQSGVNTLVNWVKETHPELDGFINDMTPRGAQNYRTAIDLYQNSK